MTLRASNQVLCNVWSYDFYDIKLSTEKQRRHMINSFIVSDNIKSLQKTSPALGLSISCIREANDTTRCDVS